MNYVNGLYKEAILKNAEEGKRKIRVLMFSDIIGTIKSLKYL